MTQTDKELYKQMLRVELRLENPKAGAAEIERLAVLRMDQRLTIAEAQRRARRSSHEIAQEAGRLVETYIGLGSTVIQPRSEAVIQVKATHHGWLRQIILAARHMAPEARPFISDLELRNLLLMDAWIGELEIVQHPGITLSMTSETKPLLISRKEFFKGDHIRLRVRNGSPQERTYCVTGMALVDRLCTNVDEARRIMMDELVHEPAPTPGPEIPEALLYETDEMPDSTSTMSGGVALPSSTRN